MNGKEKKGKKKDEEKGEEKKRGERKVLYSISMSDKSQEQALFHHILAYHPYGLYREPCNSELMSLPTISCDMWTYALC